MILFLLVAIQSACIYLSQDRQLRDLQGETGRAARAAAAKLGKTFEQARHCLVLLTNSPAIQSMDPGKIQPLLVKYLGDYDFCANFGLIQSDGRDFVSALPVDDRYFSEVLPWVQHFHLGKLSVSGYVNDRIARTEGVNLILPLRENNQPLVGVFVTVPVSTLQAIVKNEQSAIIELFDRSRTVIARNVDAETYKGTLSKHRPETKPGFIQDDDDVNRLYYVSPVPGSEDNLWIAAGLAEVEASEKDVLDKILHCVQAGLIVILGVWIIWNERRRSLMPAVASSEHGELAPASVLSSHPEHASTTGHPGLSPLAQTIVDASTNVIFFTDPQGLFLGCNRAFEEWVAKSKPEILGKLAAEIFPLELAEHYREISTSPFGKNAQKTFESPFVCGDGVSREVKVVVSPVHDAGSNMIGLMAIMVDETEGRNLQRRIRENEERFRFTVSAAADAITVMDERGKIVLWNQAAENLFGYAPEEAIGQAAHQLLAPTRFHKQWLKHFEDFVEGSCDQVIGKRMELEAMKKDGTQIAVELFVGSVQLDGKWHTIGMICDLTIRKKAEGALRDSEAVLAGVCDKENESRGIIVLTKENVELFSDGGLSEMLESNPEMVEAIGESAPAARLWTMNLTKSRTSGEPVPFTYVQVKGEKSRPMRAVVNVVSDGAGGFSVAFTAKPVNENNIEDQLKRTQFAMDRSPQGVLWANAAGCFIYANASSVSILGYSRDQLLHMSMADIDKGVTGTWADHWEEVKLRQTLTYESRIQTREGEEVSLLLTVNYLNIEDCEYTCVFVHDNSQNKRSEQAVATLTAELEQRGGGASVKPPPEIEPEPAPEQDLSAEEIQALLNKNVPPPEEQMSDEAIQALLQGGGPPA